MLQKAARQVWQAVEHSHVQLLLHIHCVVPRLKGIEADGCIEIHEMTGALCVHHHKCLLILSRVEAKPGLPCIQTHAAR